MNRWQIFVLTCIAPMALANVVIVAQDKSKSDASSGQVDKAKTGKPEHAADAKPLDPIKFSVADGQLEFSAPGDWKKVEPASTMIDAEFSIEPIEGDAKSCRLTVMGAGGTIEANIDRWIGQVQQPDGSATKDKAAITKKEIAGMTIHLVDVTGTYLDQRGPQAPKVELKDYRLLAAILETDADGSYFVKLYGPVKTIAKHRDAFVKMVEEAKLIEK